MYMYTGQIWLDNVGCSSDDEILEDCHFPGWGVHNCGHFEDVGVVCRSSIKFNKALIIYTIRYVPI